VGSPKVIVLDTHVLLWWANGSTGLLSTPALTALDTARSESQVLVSAITAWEIAMLVQNGRIELAFDLDVWLNTVRAIDRLRFVPIDPEIAVASVRLPGDLHRDPADRFIVATAHRFGAHLMTADEKLRAYPHVVTVW
jgi:PIN domain nuclease of toxin-antitoxin system